MRIRKRSVISRVGQRRQVVIPREICEELRLREGDFVEVRRERGTVVIRPKTLVDPDDTLTPEEEKIVAKGFAQLKRGQSVGWDELKRELDL